MTTPPIRRSSHFYYGVYMKYVRGNLITLAREGEFDIIIHGCNCFHKFGKGIARSIQTAFPKAYEADLETRKGDQSKLGSYSSAHYPCVVIINAYTQYRYGSNEVQIDYPAVERVFQSLSQIIDTDRRIGIPQIGAGLAGGDWPMIESIINRFMDGYNLTCVVYDGT